ncbi:MAG: protein translocase subunit SecD [Chloroflexi bacterium]|nr:protein translocase subunit SecD [Chloroflexota bacterium]
MVQRDLRLLIGIVIVAAAAIFIAYPSSPGIHVDVFGIKVNQDFPIHEGLDLQGGVQVLLQANVPPGTKIDPQAMQAAQGIVASRVNALGVSEPLVQSAGSNRIIVELPGLKNPDQAIKTFGQTGLLEFVDAGSTYLPTGTVVTTTLGGPSKAVLASQTKAGSTVPPSPPQTFKTIMTGKDLQSASVGFDNLGRPEIDFTLTSQGAKIFSNYTTKNVGKYLAITMDKQVIECPVIQNPITDGRGVINGGSGPGFSLQQAQSLVIQLKYGALPIPLKVVESNQVGPTLGAAAIHQSIIAGIIGLGIVLVFMLLYYRIPGLLADIALLIYAAVVFALFRIIPVTLTLAGIAGFILSIGMAVDANILIFERMKEELRGGRTLRAAIDAGFARAWTSIRDANVSTLITCGILFWFGMNFGASIIQGFALTLAIGVIVSLFSAILVSRTFLEVFVKSGLVHDLTWYGLEQPRSELAS